MRPKIRHISHLFTAFIAIAITRQINAQTNNNETKSASANGTTTARILLMVDLAYNEDYSERKQTTTLRLVNEMIDMMQEASKSVGGYIDFGIVGFTTCLEPRNQVCDNLTAHTVKTFRPFGEPLNTLTQNKADFEQFYTSTNLGQRPTHAALQVVDQQLDAANKTRPTNTTAILLLTDGLPQLPLRREENEESFRYHPRLVAYRLALGRLAAKHAQKIRDKGTTIHAILIAWRAVRHDELWLELSERFIGNVSSPGKGFQVHEVDLARIFGQVLGDIVTSIVHVVAPTLPVETLPTIRPHKEDEPKDDTAVIIGSVVGVGIAFFIIIAIAGVLVHRKRSASESVGAQTSQRHTGISANLDSVRSKRLREDSKRTMPSIRQSMSVRKNRASPAAKEVDKTARKYK